MSEGGSGVRRCPLRGTEAAEAGDEEPSLATHSATASVGQAAPDFALDDADGQTFRLADELAHGPVIVVFLRGFA